MRIASIVVLAATIGLTAACGDSKADQAPAPSAAEPAASAPAAASISAEARAEAKQVFDTRCFACHGAGGQGDGPASAGLNPKPRDLADPGWQGEVTDEHIEKIIMYGGAAVGRSPAMPANPDLASKPEVISALRELVRELGR